MKWQNVLKNEALDWDFLSKDEMQLLMDNVNAKFKKGINFSSCENKFIFDRENEITLHFLLSGKTDTLVYVTICEDGTIFWEKEENYSNQSFKDTPKDKAEFDKILDELFVKFSSLD